MILKNDQLLLRYQHFWPFFSHNSNVLIYVLLILTITTICNLKVKHVFFFLDILRVKATNRWMFNIYRFLNILGWLEIQQPHAKLIQRLFRGYRASMQGASSVQQRSQACIQAPFSWEQRSSRTWLDLMILIKRSFKISEIISKHCKWIPTIFFSGFIHVKLVWTTKLKFLWTHFIHSKNILKLKLVCLTL